jgi:hypothetical protein
LYGNVYKTAPERFKREKRHHHPAKKSLTTAGNNRRKVVAVVPIMIQTTSLMKYLNAIDGQKVVAS